MTSNDDSTVHTGRDGRVSGPCLSLDPGVRTLLAVAADAPPGGLAPIDRAGACSGAGPAITLATHLVLGSLPSAVSCARAHCRLVLAEWGLDIPGA